MNRVITQIIMCLLFSLSIFSQDQSEKIKVTDDLEILKLSDNAYIHVSYSVLPKYGRISANGLIYINQGKGFLFDTPWSGSITKDLVKWIRNTLKVKLNGFVPNHWHADCMGGLEYIHSLGIKSYSSEFTREIAKSKNLPIPKQGFKDSLILKIGNKEIICKYYGPAHSIDNVVIWIPSEKILFPGCMARPMVAKDLGNTADGNVPEWGNTIKKILKDYSSAEIVIPGHGSAGGIDLLNHTIDIWNSVNK